MSRASSSDDHSKQEALVIYDESTRYRDAVTKQVLVAVVLVVGAYVLIWMLSSLQRLQLGLALGDVQPLLSISPVSGGTIAVGYTFVAGMILTIRFGISSSAAGSVVEMARERASRQLVHILARTSVVASIALAAVAIGTYTLPAGPGQLDLYRTMGPLVVSLGLAIAAADAAMRTEDEQTPRLQWAALKRERQTLRRRLAFEVEPRLSSRERWVQRAFAFLVVPLVLTAATLVVWPVGNPLVFGARLAFILLTSVLAFFIVREFQLRLLRGRALDALEFAILWGLVGLVYWLTSMLPGIQESDAEVHVGPIVRSMSVVALLSIAGPFLAMTLLSRRSIFGRPGLIRDSAISSCLVRIARLSLRMKEMKKSESTGASPRNQNDTATVSLAVALAFPFNFMSAREALLVSRRHDGVGRKRAIWAITIATLAAAFVVTALVVLLVWNPDLVWCSDARDRVCLVSR